MFVWRIIGLSNTLCGQNVECLNITARALCDLLTTVLCRVKENHDSVVSLKWTMNCEQSDRPESLLLLLPGK
jgi:hypothetical protein